MSVSVFESVKKYLSENIEELKDIARELNAWDGSFDNFVPWENDEEFFNTFFEDRPMEAVRAAHFGDYRWSDEYVRFDGYGNLESLTEYTLRREAIDCIDEIIQAMLDNRPHIYVSVELQEIIEEAEEE